jgi:glutaredoxin-like protein
VLYLIRKGNCPGGAKTGEYMPEKEKLLNESITKQVREVFSQLKNPVEVLFFEKKQDCDYCDDTRKLLEEVTALSDKLNMTVYDADEHADVAMQYKVDKIPGIVLAGRDGDQTTDYGIRFAGIPSGHEFSSLINDLVMVSGRDSRLSDQTREYLQNLKKPLLLQVFVTPT